MTATINIFIATLIGAFAWSESFHFAPLIALIPLIWSMAKSRKEAFLLMFFYYLAASRGIVPGAYVFFQDGNYARAVLFWIVSAVLLSAPWGLLSLKDNDTRVLRTLKLCGGLFASIPPPLGIIGWTNPLLAAGVFFPNWGYWGFAAIIALWAFLVADKNILNTQRVLQLVAVLLVFTTPLAVPSHPDFIGVNTEFGRMVSGSAEFGEIANSKIRMITVISDLLDRRTKGKLNGKSIVLPETVCGLLSEEERKEWERRALQILDFGWNGDEKTLFLGAELRTGADENRKYDNVTLSFGRNNVRFR